MTSELDEELQNKIDSCKKAGEIAKKVKQAIEGYIQPSMSLYDIAERIEQLIEKEGGKYAFPANIGINEIAAHFTPIEEKERIESDDLIKIDFGVHIDGYPVDNAFSLHFGENDEFRSMIETAKGAVNVAIENIKVGIDLSEIGVIIEDFVKDRGFKVIKNLSGHLIDRYDLHGGKEIPTYADSKFIGKVEEGEIYAVEVFVTNGEGYVKSIDETYIYSLIKELPKRLPIRIKAAREILNFVRKERKTLPFSLRWLKKYFDEATIKIGVSSLEQYGVLIGYPVLVEKKEGAVAQHEETILVKKDEIEILT